jgi:hypothetical protein
MTKMLSSLMLVLLSWLAVDGVGDAISGPNQTNLVARRSRPVPLANRLQRRIIFHES